VSDRFRTKYRLGRRVVALSAAAGLAVAGCNTTTPVKPTTASSAPPSSAASQWVDQPVTFVADRLTIYATYRHRVAPGRTPAALLIAGSGPTDRNGNDPQLPNANTLKTVADWLSEDGVASLRYDKLGSGQTGLGPYAHNVGAIGVAPFEDEAAVALRYLAAQPGVETTHLSVWGHSEGALYALLLATHPAPGDPPIQALGLLEPLSIRYLDVLQEQIGGQIQAARKADTITAAEALTMQGQLTATVADIRAHGTDTEPVPAFLSSVFNPSDVHYLAEADRFDPATLAAQLPAHTPVLLTCSNDDIQVTCAEVAHLRSGLVRSQASITMVTLTGVDHLLKVDPSRSSVNYNAILPFSPQLQKAIRVFATQTA
jgi:alpha-beta hydrolase superfamily lysophospholipase